MTVVAGILKGKVMSRKNCIWIKIEYDVQPPILICELCGSTEKVILPAPINKFIERSNRFAVKHKDCDKKDNKK